MTAEDWMKSAGRTMHADDDMNDGGTGGKRCRGHGK